MRTITLSNKKIAAPSLQCGQILAIRADGSVDVRLESGQLARGCEILQTCEGAGLQLQLHDLVVVLPPVPSRRRGVVLGRVNRLDAGAIQGSAVFPNSPPSSVPDTLVLEAERELTLRVGDGSITLRADGKILIQGKDLVSHAQRMNRIKGGSVSIN